MKYRKCREFLLMAKNKTNSVVKKEMDRLDNLGPTVSIDQIEPTTFVFNFNFEIMKYHRQRVSRFHQYDPLSKYKDRVRTMIINSMAASNLEIPENCWKAPFEIDIVCARPPKKGSGSKKSLVYKLLGSIKRSIYPDLDNLAKTPMDIMNELIWYDDAQAYKLSIEKLYSLEEYTKITVKFRPEDPKLSVGRLTSEEATRYEGLINQIDTEIWNTTK